MFSINPSPPDTPDLSDAALALLHDLFAREVSVWVECRLIRYRDPLGTLTTDDLARMLSLGPELVSILQPTQPQPPIPPEFEELDSGAIPPCFCDQCTISMRAVRASLRDYEATHGSSQADCQADRQVCKTLNCGSTGSVIVKDAATRKRKRVCDRCGERIEWVQEQEPKARTPAKPARARKGPKAAKVTPVVAPSSSGVAE